MIKGFSEETAPLSEKELTLLPVFIHSLRKHIGKDKAVTSTAIASGLKNAGYGNVSGARIRKIINHIRTNHLVQCLVSSSNGYYICNSAEEIQSYIESLEERCSSIMAVARALQCQKQSLLYKSNPNLFS